MGLDENKAVVQRLFDAINSGSLDELPEVVAPDVVDHNAVIFMQPEGPGGVQEGVRMLLQGFPDLHLTTEELVAEGDRVVVRFTMSGTNTGDYRGLPVPTQQRFESEAIAVLRVADGKVAEIRGTADRLGMLTQLGILPDLG
ncbi:MAG TPA: ester cyclase [Actinomycetes bacterium]|nr:ester cyclase [Actinomycetes bacterium]